MSNRKLTIVYIAVLLSLTMSLIFPAGVLADDTQPPAPDAPEVTPPPEETSPEEASAVETTVPESSDEVPTPSDEAAPADSSTADVMPEETATDTESTTDDVLLLAQLPEGTEVVVLNEEGQAVPLASQEAETVIAGSDPMWCPDGVDPGGVGCTSGYSSMTALLAALSGANQPVQNGTIWIEKTYNSSAAEPGGTTAITIDGGAYTTWRNYSLTINGGWDGAGTNTTSGTSLFFDDRFRIINWWNDVTVNNIVVDGVTGNPSVEIEIDTPVTNTYSVVLNNVEVRNNANNIGAFIDNDESTGSVTVSNSRFINNGDNDDGLQILAMGNVTLLNVTATDNGDEGVQIDNRASSSSSTVQVLGTNVFTGNSGDGLYILSDGNITLNNITANNNLDNGIDIDNTSGNTNATFTVTGTNSFSNNVNNGMNVLTEGAITLSNIVASGNTAGTGAYLMNDYTGAGGVTLTGANVFNTNYNSGLVIDSRGAVSIGNVTASGNIRADGVNIDNCSWGGGTLGCLGSGDVTLIGASVFANNGNGGDRGLYVNSNGNVLMADVTSTGNRGNGVEINNTSNTSSTTTATVQIGGTNVFTGNSGTGLVIYSKGNIGLNNVTAGANTSSGVYIENQNGTTTASVTFTGLNSFAGNTSNGVSVRSKGAITLSNVTANGSTADSGAYLRNDYSGAVGGVTLTGSNSFSNNRDYGLQVLSLGAVNLNNLTADNNVLEYGAYIYNAGTGASGDVTIAGTNSFSGNDDYGLGIVSRGAVTLENVTANGNKTADGVNINNAAGTRDVTLTGTQTFTNNGNDEYDDGLYISSQGNVSLAGVIATGNKDEGVEIDNTPGTASATVQIGGTNVFSNNVGTGLLIYSEGNVGLNNVTANTNTNGNGLYIENYNSATNGTVTLTGTNNFSGNRNSGLYVRSKGAITLSDVTANNSVVDNGVILDNDETGAVGGVTITGINNVFSGNNDYGLGINSRGAVSLENITASGNKLEDGVYIDNGNGTGSVTLTGTLTFTNNGNDNNDDGLYVRTQSSVTLENVSATLNKDDGVEIDNTPGTGSVSLTGGTYNQNAGDGLYVRSDGLITLENVTANQNGDDGGEITNDTGGSIASANVFVLNSTFNSNGDDGLVAASNLDVVLMNVTAQNNDNDGVELYSDGDNVVLCGGVFSGNDIQAGSTDYNVRVTGGTRTRSSDIVVTNWSPSTGWTTVPSGTGRCANTDNDVFPNDWDTDDDNDGVLDVNDAFPLDPTESVDTDGDGIGNNADTDDDGDGVLDVNDAFPLDPTESVDTDGDGIGNNADTDDDNDTVLDTNDACPVGAGAGTDTDGDGCKDAAEDNDDDNDGMLDGVDACPIGASTGTDTDGDGCKDTEDIDNDNDGVLDVDDACPLGASMGTDVDGDGCKDATEDNDDDNDGVLDVNDRFPQDPNEWADIDMDGIGDNSDPADDRRTLDKGGSTSSAGTSLLIPVTGAALICPVNSFEMAGFQVVFDDLCGYSTELSEVSEDTLPGALPGGNKFIAGVGIVLLQDGNRISNLPANTAITLSIKIPSGLDGESLAVLRWDSAAGAWVEKLVTITDGNLVLTGITPGTFVLVEK
ncbi:Alpha-agarase [Anaerolineales bacterium]|nr:Alpha-agarase [Anaerolineales bacterium]